MNAEADKVENKQSEPPPQKEAAPSRAPKSGLARVLPTERVSFDKQMSVLRAYAAASGPAKKAVSNDDVAAVFNDLAASSISLCNPFFSDVGLLISEGRKQRPADAVFDYLQAFQWNEDTAAQKLRDTFARTWAAEVLLPKLNFRQLTRHEAIQFLADDSKAQRGHRKNLDLLLDFLNAAGVVKADGSSVAKNTVGGFATEDPAKPQVPASTGAPNSGRQSRTEELEESQDVERFTIPIPGKDAAVITVPRNLDADDWDMLSLMIGTFIKRLRGDTIKGGGQT